MIVRCPRCALSNTPTEPGERCNRCGHDLPGTEALEPAARPLPPYCWTCRAFAEDAATETCIYCEKRVRPVRLTVARRELLLRACVGFALYIGALGFEGVEFRALARVFELGDVGVERALLHAVERFASVMAEEETESRAPQPVDFARRYAARFVSLLAGESCAEERRRLEELEAEATEFLTAHLAE